VEIVVPAQTVSHPVAKATADAAPAAVTE